MKIFKFGGASLKDAQGFHNVLHVLRHTAENNLVVVASAMGKMTNALEEVLKAYFEDPQTLPETIHAIKTYHQEIVSTLFMQREHPVHAQVEHLLRQLEDFLARNKSPEYDYVYDQVVPYGELLSTTILHAFLKENQVDATWLDVRELLKTDSTYREARVDWTATQQHLSVAIRKTGIFLTQGFIGSDANGFMTTLGREGSDYTAAIIAYEINAQSVTIWKDVPGVLNADPRYFENAQLLSSISYREAIELAFYGASVIHPKTLQPLQNKEIPLFVKSFLNPKAAGTRVGMGVDMEPLLPCFILKKGQVLLSLSSLDFSFMIEEHIGEVFKLLGANRMKVDLIQNSAISFSLCVDNTFNNLEALVAVLKAKFKVTVIKDVDLYTVMHCNTVVLASLEKGRNILLKQLVGDTAQLVVAYDNV